MDYLGNAAIDNLPIVPQKMLHFLTIWIEVGVGFTDEVFNACPVGIRHGLVDENEATAAIFGKDEMGNQVDNLPELCLIVPQGLVFLVLLRR